MSIKLYRSTALAIAWLFHFISGWSSLSRMKTMIIPQPVFFVLRNRILSTQSFWLNHIFLSFAGIALSFLGERIWYIYKQLWYFLPLSYHLFDKRDTEKRHHWCDIISRNINRKSTSSNITCETALHYMQHRWMEQWTIHSSKYKAVFVGSDAASVVAASSRF